jgi:hypothetical protein
MFPKQKVSSWVVETEDGRSSIVAGVHPAQVYNYVRTFWPERNISTIKRLDNGNG